MQRRSRRPPPPTRRLVLALLAAACAAGQDDDSGGDDSGLGDGDRDRGAILYREHCAPCHGLSGEGGVGPGLRGWDRGVAALVAVIDQTMPTQNPAVCAAACADDVAAYILAELTGEICASGQPALAPRQLRLLTRREYDATVRDLLRLGPAAAGGPCDIDADCDLAAESCVAGACAADPCGRHTFIFPSAQAHGSVHVAGSFNGWPAAVAAGGWSMEHVPQDNLYYTKRDLPSGAHTYKFVIDEADWIPDPNNPSSEPDGYGGQNSLLQLTCDGGGQSLFAPARDFPVESRPKGYEYDNNAAAGLVTATHVDKQLAAAAAVAALALTRLDQLLPCDPLPDPAACADAFLADFGARAFRRPLSAEERAKYRGLILGEPDFSAGVGVALRVMLASPYFLYRSELGEEQSGGGARLTSYELASALSYAFWGTMPDDQLFAAAAADQLRTPEQIEAQARRLLGDPRARELVATFAAQWLGVEPLRSASKSPSLHPEWSQELALALIEETRRFIAHVVFDGDGRYDALLTADYTFLNGALAAHYDLSAPPGGEFALADNGPDRAGLLGHAAILANYAHSDQSSPVRRGLFVRERLLCQHFGTPPANAGGVPEVDADATTRERFRQHSADQSCALCHQFIDELGFGFERFDAVGRYRQQENGLPIDPAGDMNDVEAMGAGTNAPFTTLPQLAQILAASDAAPACFARQAYRFTMGYLEAPHDLCGLAAIESRFAQSGYDVRELLVAIVTAPSFALRQ